MIILSSFGLRSPIVAEKAEKYINPTGMKVVVIPFAGFNNTATASREINEGLIPFGFDPDNISVLDVHNPELCKERKFDMIYVPGGDPLNCLVRHKNAIFTNGFWIWLRKMRFILGFPVERILLAKIWNI